MFDDLTSQEQRQISGSKVELAKVKARNAMREKIKEVRAKSQRKKESGFYGNPALRQAQKKGKRIRDMRRRLNERRAKAY